MTNRKKSASVNFGSNEDKKLFKISPFKTTSVGKIFNGNISNSVVVKLGLV